MTTYNTGNPIGSTDARDRSDNSENLDLAVNSLSKTFFDRLGIERDTLEGIYQKSAYYRAGTFDAGYTLTNNRQTLAYGNIEYSWSGSFGENGKQVPPASTPETTGGIGAGAWVDRTQETLKSELHPTGLDENIIALGADPTATVSSTSVIREKLNVDGELIVPKGKYLIDSNIVIAGKDISILCHPEAEFISTNGSGFGFFGTIGVEVSAGNITDGDTRVTTALDCAAGDYVQISGAISHELYIPYRYTNSKFIAKVTAVSGGVISLDRKILFSLSSVTIGVLSPTKVNLVRMRTNGVSVGLTRATECNIDLHSTGSISQPLSLNQVADSDVRFKGTDLHATQLGLILNDVNNSRAYVIGNNIGLYDGSSTKSIRANGIQNCLIDAVLNSSTVGDCTVYGSRNCTIKNLSAGVGKYYRDNNITSGNRLEGMQFSECDDFDITAHMTDVDDQGVELLSCVRTTLRPKIETLANSSEGAIVVKGGSVDTTIINPVIRAQNPYAIKIEGTDGQSTSSAVTTRTNLVKIINPDITGSQYGVAVRDSPIVYDANVSILGGAIYAQSPVIAFENHNGVLTKGTKITTTGGHAIQGLAEGLSVIDVECLGCNDTTIRAVVSSGANDFVSNVVSDGAIYTRYKASYQFGLARYPANKVSRIYISEDNFSFYPKNGGYSSSTIPTLYKFTNGDIVYKYNYTAGDYLGWACTDGGANYSAWSATTAYLVGKRITANSNVYECIIAGTSSSTAPSGTGSSITDGTATWSYVSAVDAAVLTPYGIVRKRVIGQATISAGSTSVTITHNLGVTPVGWGMSSNQNLSGGMWVTSVTSAQMTVFIPSALGSTLTITYWVEG